MECVCVMGFFLVDCIVKSVKQNIVIIGTEIPPLISCTLSLEGFGHADI